MTLEIGSLDQDRIRWRKHSPVKAWLRRRSRAEAAEQLAEAGENMEAETEQLALAEKGGQDAVQKPEMHRMPPQGLKIPERQCLPAA